MSYTNFEYPVRKGQWCEDEQETKDYEKEDNTYDEMEGEVDDYIQTDESPEVIQQERVDEYDEERMNATVTDTDEQFQQDPVLSNANESNDGSERMTQSIATIELSSANKSVLCDRTFDVQLYLRDAQHRWTLNKERAQIYISCVSPNLEIFVRVYCNSRSVKTQTNGLSSFKSHQEVGFFFTHTYTQKLNFL
ncbi:hypothetical protein RFI_08843 [Reticulomyxa filosa]|uniref:Uncharacterized protein n=1 Tax=Reticulomyxa filosa TaxID=46433 RepID=X6NPR2_RETFI|nr:hypothetical protein RFI_08843 [Reticulomyxa filosa]|eukprot:ETO28290.1 hypothetical protein RFI_08843 [Reticulomyxa filosa]